MAQDYIVLNEQSENGMIAINKSVFQSIAEISIDDVENAVRLNESRFVKPLQLKIEKNKLHIIADIKIKYGANVNQTSELVQNKIYENVLFMTGYKANEVTVNVTGFEF
ncbi:MAG: Asp23/Gls24 family envelope stress response protein [Solobacterium sp.]|nr:Asp23/Gls24 family envelope stress response protein [Solobacterium sp.]